MHAGTNSLFARLAEAMGAPALLRLPGMPIKLSATPGRVRKAPPLIGEDNASVYRDLLGIDENELAELHAEGVI